MSSSNITEELCIWVKSQWDRSHGFYRDQPNMPSGLSRSLLAPYLCITVKFDIGSGIVEGDVQELEPSLHLGLGKL